MFNNGRKWAVVVPILLFVAVLIGLVSVDGVVLVQARDENDDLFACALTPDMTDGQGLRSSRFGLRSSRFEVEISSLGLRSSRFGLRSSRFDALIEEIESEENLINDSDWLAGLLGDIDDDSGRFNTAPTTTTIIIADDHGIGGNDSHGAKVMRVAQELLDKAKIDHGYDLNIEIIPVDLSSGTNPYRMDTVVTRIEEAISFLPVGTRVVINLSWGLIPCEDSEPPQGFPEFYFYDFLTAYNNAYDPNIPEQPVEPTLQCVRQISNNQLEAVFGYKNYNADPVTIPIGSANNISPKPEFQGQPRLFETGWQQQVFSVSFSKNKGVTWNLGDLSVSASKTDLVDKPCDPAPEPVEIQPIIPTACVVENDKGIFARFGYINPNESALTLPVDDTLTIKVGGRNRFAPTPFDRGQTITFLPGEHIDVFEVLLDGSDLTWIINSAPIQGGSGKQDVTASYEREATASPESPGCVSSGGFGLEQYITDQLGVLPEDVDAYLAYLFQKGGAIDSDSDADGYDDGLHAYLAKLAAENKTKPEGSVLSIVTAATGNYALLFGPPADAVAPASYLSTVGTGASTDNSALQAVFSHEGNIMAPGSWSLDSVLSSDELERILIGTSFSAPRAAFIGALWLTYEDENTCYFDGTHPPLIAGALYDSEGNPPGAAPNMPLLSGSMPFKCVPNSPPVVDTPDKQTNHVGDEGVLLQVKASDPDNDPLTFSAVGLPPSLTIDAHTGEISGTLTVDDIGTHTVTVFVTDERGSTTMVEFDWIVEPVPKIDVEIDIKPNSYPNTINLGSHGVVQVAILSSDDFDATLINPDTVELANASIRFHGHGNSGKIRDVDGDNLLDLVVHVETEALDLTSQDVEATLTAEMRDGRLVEGVDTVRIVPGKAPVLVVLSDGTTTTSRTPLLTWESVPDAKCYLVQVDDNAGFSSPQEATVVGTEQHSPKKLPFGQYFWRVQVGGTCDIDPSPWSAVWSFTVTR